MLFPRVTARTSFHRLHQPHTHTHTHTHRPPPTNTKAFSTTSPKGATGRDPTHYEVLDVPITASTAEIKKQFYSLSLRHHPDRTKDPSSHARFTRISSAYHILSNTQKRSLYDREHGIHAHTMSNTHSSASPGHAHPMGSHSSHGFAGSRPASGLSKRKGPFRGPPPSFYAHGGYGNRRAPGAGASSSSSAGAGAGGRRAGTASDEDPTSFIDRNPVNHFNARGHYRTQTAEDTRRQQRRSREMGAALNEQYIGGSGDFALRFLIVCGILAGAGAMTGFFEGPGEKGKGNGKNGRRKE